MVLRGVERSFLALTILLMWGTASGPVQSAAWLLDKGDAQVITTVSASQALTEYDDDSNEVSRTPFVKYSVRTLIQYGLKETLTISFEPVLDRIEIGFEGDKSVEKGLNSTGIGTRTRLLDYGTHVISAQSTIYVPGQLETTESTILSLSGWDFDTRLLYGGSANIKFWKFDWPMFWDLQLGYRLRSDDPLNEYHGDFTYGINLRDKTQLLIQSFNILSAGARDPSENTAFSEFRFHKAQVSSVYELNRYMKVQLGGFSTVGGRNIIKEEGAFAALWLEF